MRPSDELRIYLTGAKDGDTLEISIPAARELMEEIDQLRRDLKEARNRKELT